MPALGEPVRVIAGEFEGGGGEVAKRAAGRSDGESGGIVIGMPALVGVGDDGGLGGEQEREAGGEGGKVSCCFLIGEVERDAGDADAEAAKRNVEFARAGGGIGGGVGEARGAGIARVAGGAIGQVGEREAIEKREERSQRQRLVVGMGDDERDGFGDAFTPREAFRKGRQAAATSGKAGRRRSIARRQPGSVPTSM